MKYDLEPTLLSQLLTIYNFLNILASDQQLAEFLGEALKCLPGVRAFNLCLRNFCGPKNMAPPPDACRICPVWAGQMDDALERFPCHVVNSEIRRIYPIETFHRVYGHALADVNPAAEYTLYEPYVRNLFHVVALTIENRVQQSRVKAVNQKLQESRHTLQTFLDAIPESAFLIDPQGTVLATNTTTAERLGKTVENIIGIDIHDLIPEKVAQHRRPYVEKALRTGLPVSFEDARCETWVSHRISPIKDHDGNVSKIAVLGIDITDRKQDEIKIQMYSRHLEELVETRTLELKNAQQALLAQERIGILAHFADSMAHEIRNPLAAIDSSAFFLNMKLKEPDEKIRGHLESISNNAHKAGAIIASLLNLTRMENPKTRPHALADVIQESLESLKIPEKVEIITYFPDKPVFVQIDVDQIRMALKNIIQNAVQAMDESGALTISVRRIDTDQAEISIADTGPGIPPENIEKVFDPLFSTKTHGIGFGLSIAKMIIENHGGTIRAKSSPDKGTVFTILLPCN